MSTTPARYQPDTRLIDDPSELYRLYVERDLSIREIASEHASVGRTKVSEALDDHGITDDEAITSADTESDENAACDSENAKDMSENYQHQSERGIDPPQAPNGPCWERLT